ncbi:MAG TPA: histidinol-phosphate transaminase [Symbiobacteriaceae bacterium]|nr:histidinol-phosphate transaminase [Symbiobacteriaceae bacterium]
MPAVRPAVKAMRSYVPGKPVADVQRELGITDLIKLNQNENPLGPSPKAVAAATAAMREVHTYPEGTTRALRQKLAAMWDLPPEWFIVGNGSDEVFRLLAETYLEPGDKAIIPVPSFAGYPLVVELMGATPMPVPLAANGSMDLDSMAEMAENLHAKMIFLCRPNNPTGAVFEQHLFPAFMAHVPSDTLVVLDEAYREFDETPFDSKALLMQYPNVVVTRTFSKIYGMAGFRLGYGVARPEVLTPFYTVRDPFSVNNLAAAAGLAALDDTEHLERTQELTRKGKARLYEFFEEWDIPYTQSQANFVMFDVEQPATEVYEALLRRGVLVRPCGSFGLPTCLRVTVGTEAENKRFLEALEQVLQEE